MKLYRYLTGPDDASFCRRVTEALQNGWELYGNPTLTFDGEHIICGHYASHHARNQLTYPCKIK